MSAEAGFSGDDASAQANNGTSGGPSGGPSGMIGPLAARRPALRQRLAWWLWGLIPDAIVLKELHSIGRSRSTYIVRGVFTLALTVLVALVFAGTVMDSVRMSNGSVVELDGRALEGMAPILGFVIIWFQMVLLPLAAASLCGGAICDDRRKGTLSALLTTPLTAWQIVVGKLLGAGGQLLILSAVALPLLLAVRIFGGLPAVSILQAYALVLPTVALCGSVTILCSMFQKRPASAAFSGIVITSLILFSVPIAEVALALRTGGIPRPYVMSFSSPLALGELSASIFSATQATAWLPASLFTLCATAVTLTVASCLLRWTVQREGAGGFGWGMSIKARKKAREQAQEQGIARAAAVSVLAADAVLEAVPSGEQSTPEKTAKRKHPVVVGASRRVAEWPVLWRELSPRRRFGWAGPGVALLVLFGGASYLYWHIGFEEIVAQHVIAVIGSIGCLLAALNSGVSSISGERESRTLDVLMTAPLSAWEVVVSKCAGALRRSGFIVGVLVINIIIAGVILGDVSLLSPLFMVMVLAGPILLFTCTGVYFSQKCKSSSMAGALNVMLAFALYLIVPLVASLMLRVLMNENAAQAVWEAWCYIWPFTMFSASIHEAASSGATQSYTFAGFRGVSKAEFAVYVLGYLGAYLALCAGVVKMTAVNLGRETNRKA